PHHYDQLRRGNAGGAGQHRERLVSKSAVRIQQGNVESVILPKDSTGGGLRMLFRKCLTLACVGVVMAASGCATGAPSGDELRNTIYSTHRMVQNLDANLSGTVSDLTQTAATLTARMDASDQELRNLSSLAVENQRKLEQLQASLDGLTATLYRHFNLSPPPPVASPSFTPGVSRGGIVVQPPAQTQPQTFQPPAQSFPPPQVSPAPAPVPGGVGVEPRAPLESSGVPQQPPASAAGGMDEITHYRSAQQLYAREDFAAALQQFDQHMQLFPNSANAANAAYWKAHCYFKLGDYPQAIIGFEDLRSKYPTSDKVPTAMHNQGVAYSRLGQNQRAMELFQQLVDDYPNDPATEGAREKLRQLQGQQ
ncbi:MAG TPA: tol-pal system protein YbgF, partial [Burkholderiales bacterium]|nr:tol-pal system protein YbgF [Burkholderiales bacterium]